MDGSSFKWVKKHRTATDTTLVWGLVEMRPQICRVTYWDENGKMVSTPDPIEMVDDARFKYNSKTQKHEMQPFERSAERRSWFAQTYLLKPKK